MHTTPYTAKSAGAPPPENTGPLPLRQEAPELPPCDPPQKDIADTAGGKITDAIIYKGLGFVGNSAVSVGVTYWINPTKQAKWAREKTLIGAQRLLKDFLPQPAINNMVDISFMLIAGTFLTAIMAPLVNRRDRIAHYINKKLGKDTDILPEHLRVYNTPATLEDKVEQELKKRVHYGQTSRDLWKARWSAIWLPVFGDMALGKISAEHEKNNKWSIDTVSWKVGQHLYDEVLPKSLVRRMGDFFKRHGAGIKDVRQNNRPIYDRLRKVERHHEKINTLLHGKEPVTREVQDDRMMIADQTRLLAKEVGWTLILAGVVESLTNHFQLRRIRREEDRALAKMREEGIIPAGVSVETDKRGHVSLTTTKDYVPTAKRALAEAVIAQTDDVTDAKIWTDQTSKKIVDKAIEKARSHAGAVDKSREVSGQSATIA